MRLVYLAIFILLVGCNDRRDPPEIRFGPPVVPADMGDDLTVADMPPTTPSCIEKTDGVACPLEGAAGVCLEERCVLVACEQGFGDCNALANDGCETRFDVITSCGGCDAICTGDETCQLGRSGYGCTTGFSCPRDTFDVDGDLSNGCEISTEWGESITLFQVTPQVVERDEDELLIAGVSGQDRTLVVGINNITLDAAPTDEAVALGVGRFAGEAFVAWPDGVSLVGVDDDFWSADCVEPPEIVDAALVSGVLAVASNEDIAFLSACDEGLCEDKRFYQADYVAAFRDTALPPAVAGYGFEASEIDSCDACLFDVSGLAVDAACVQGSCTAEALMCDGCEPSGATCPGFKPVALAPSAADENRLYVVTARGVVAFRVTHFAPIFRLEEPFVPGMVFGSQYVGVAVEQTGPQAERLVLFGADGSFRTLELSGDPLVTVRPLHAPARLAANPAELTGFEAMADYAIVADPSNAWAVGRVGAAVKSVGLVADTIPGGVVSSVVGTSSTPSDIEVYYSSPGQLQIRRVFRSE